VALYRNIYNTPQHKIKNMKEDSGLEDLFEEDKAISPATGEMSISKSLALAGNVFLWIGWVGLIVSVMIVAAEGTLFPLVLGIGSLLSCWISSLVFKGLSKIIDLLEDIKNK
tara:strand:- start:116 stop:451 length:336 start_codon:yes stop_codon:yes gene_type:complete